MAGKVPLPATFIEKWPARALYRSQVTGKPKPWPTRERVREGRALTVGAAPVWWHLNLAQRRCSAVEEPPPSAPQYRCQVVELVRAGRTPGELAHEFEGCASAIRNRVRQADRDEVVVKRFCRAGTGTIELQPDSRNPEHEVALRMALPADQGHPTLRFRMETKGRDGARRARSGRSAASREPQDTPRARTRALRPTRCG